MGFAGAGCEVPATRRPGADDEQLLAAGCRGRPDQQQALEFGAEQLEPRSAGRRHVCRRWLALRPELADAAADSSSRASENVDAQISTTLRLRDRRRRAPATLGAASQGPNDQVERHQEQAQRQERRSKHAAPAAARDGSSRSERARAHLLQGDPHVSALRSPSAPLPFVRLDRYAGARDLPAARSNSRAGLCAGTRAAS